MTDQPNRGLGERAEAQHGVFTRSDAHSLGIAQDALLGRIAEGRYTRLYPGVFAVTGAPDSNRRRLSAAVRSFPALAAISHQTAAEMWGLTKRGVRQIEVVTTRWDRVRRSDLVAHESLDLIAADVVDLDGIPVTTPVRTVVDLGASNRWLVEAALEEGIRKRLFSLADVEKLVARVGRRGRRGVGVIRPLIEARRRWDSVTDSALEDRFRKLLASAGVPQPTAQYEIRDPSGGLVCRADFSYPESRLLIELDSEAHHMDRMTFRHDRRKQNGAIVLGWTVLRYTWWDLEEHPWKVSAEVAAALGGTADSSH